MAKTVSNQMNKWEAELARYAKKQSTAEATATSGGNFISLRPGKMIYKGVEATGGKMNLVILGQIIDRHYYLDDYSPSAPVSPVCFAFGEFDEDGKLGPLEPHNDSHEKQCEDCAHCEWNQFGTAKMGKGKACRECRRIAVISEGDLGNPGAEIALLKVPITSVKRLRAYVKSLTDGMGKPTFAVVTEVSCHQDDKTMLRVEFEAKAAVPPEALPAIFDMLDRAHAELVTPYQPYQAPEKPATPAKKSRF